MISFWLLCWKLLRATTGLRRTAAELTDGNRDNSSPSNSNPVDNSSTLLEPTDPDCMEMSSPTLLTDLEKNSVDSWSSQEAEELHYPESHGSQQPIRDEQKKEEAAEGDGKTDGDECPVFEIGEEIGGVEADEKKGAQNRREEEDGGRGERDKADEQREVDDGSKGEDEVARRERDKGDAAEEEQQAGRSAAEVEGDSLVELLFSGGHLSDCLQAELAVVYSDSDAGEDQLADFVSSDDISEAEADGGINDGVCDGDTDEEERGGEEEEEEEAQLETEEQLEEEPQEKRGAGRDDDDEEQMKLRRDLFLHSPSVSSTASYSDPDRKVPADFCVHQDTLSEHVSTEHVDFLLARQQWRKMEEEVKGQPIPQPGLKSQGSFQGTHTSLYPPTRSPLLKHRTVQPPLSSTLSPGSEDSGLDDSLYRSPLEEPETAVEREIRLTLEREERHRRERVMVAQGLTVPRPSTLQTGQSPPRPPACRTPTLSISPSPPCSSSLPRSAYHEMTTNKVFILEPERSSSASRNHLLSTAIGSLSDWSASPDVAPTTNVIVVETSNLIIRSASEFCLNSSPVSMETRESTFSMNPFFKLRSLSSQSLVEQEIRMVRQREEDWRRQREEMWRKRREEEWRERRERYNTVLVSPGLNDSISFSAPEVPDRCVSSPSSPSRTRKMERSSLSCDHKFPSSLSSVPRRQNAMARRWEASLLTNQKKD